MDGWMDGGGRNTKVLPQTVYSDNTLYMKTSLASQSHRPKK